MPKLHIVSGATDCPWIGARLQCSRSAYEAPYKQPPSPLHHATFGRISMVSGESLAAGFATFEPGDIKIHVLDCDSSSPGYRADQWTVVRVRGESILAITDEDSPDALAIEDQGVEDADDLSGGAMAPDFLAALGGGQGPLSAPAPQADTPDPEPEDFPVPEGAPDEPLVDWLAAELADVMDGA